MYLTSALAAGSPPNIVMIIADDMSWVGSSVQMDPNILSSKSDYHQTPFLEQLARDGMVFSNAYAAGPNCSPTRAALQTGKSPAQLRITDIRNGGKFEDPYYTSSYTGYPLTPPQPREVTIWPGETTLAEQIKQANPNYRAGFFGKDDWFPQLSLEGYDGWNNLYPSFLNHNVNTDPKIMFGITQLGNQYMANQVQAGKPFFAAFAHYAVKPIIEATPATVQEFQALPPGQKHTDPQYAAMHKDLDTTVGMVLDKINQLGIQDNTYVIITSDHGAPTDQLGRNVNAPLFGGKGTLFEGGLRVPLIIKGPGVAAGTYTSVPVNTMDFFPTFYELAGGTAPLPVNIEGTSIVSVLHNAGQAPNGLNYLPRAYGPEGEQYFHFPHNGIVLPDIGKIRPESAIIDGDYKLIRMYGENGGPDIKLLFNLAQNITESADPNSPLNLASQLPGTVAALEAKLDNWLDAVDASQAYDVRAPLHLTWKADQRGSVPNSWRSLQDVDYYDNEVWYPMDGLAPQVVTTTPFQPGIPQKAFQFAGNSGFNHRFFQVSDSKTPALIDKDHSSTFAMWVKFDSLASEQILFETGLTTQGLSLTLGDADGDLLADDLRFRVLGKTGNQLTLTVPINQFADPTKDFIHISAVVSDLDNQRYTELYINGALAGRVNGVLGPNELDWDSVGAASLGKIRTVESYYGALGRSDTLGALSGSGPQPFSQGNLRGKIASFEFQNYALTASEIQSLYNSALAPVDLGVTGTTSGAAIPAVRPTNLTKDSFEFSQLMVIQESKRTLAAPLPVDAIINGGITLTNTGQATLGQVAQGIEINSYLLQFDPVGQNGQITELASGTITFANLILGIMFNENSLIGSDSLVGSIGNYGVGSDRGLILGLEGALTVSANRRNLEFNLSVLGNELLQFRVLTATATIIPTSTLGADFNADGYVDHLDLAIWQTSYGINIGGDANNDGITDGRDFLIWQRQFSTPPTSFATTAVPEPATCVIIFLCLVGCGSLRVRGKHNLRVMPNVRKTIGCLLCFLQNSW